ncbi:MAG: WD40 domain protein beta Propeller [Candidatus Curtissbacteria bacterium GW2011_GWA1_40_16]|uniref:WD40 domain protein beta Propeller n=1 Tax=Candidatus Curtissbacteria bacterium GW2011_GWA1_40_16 TaxID=1618405 RepID=A0A0G0TRI0_9BACT|nr:MAG: WD40 domain protein beta Propeller [Candidatus Curtissbacteria bacterium GW2011_GWA1_40_16]
MSSVLALLLLITLVLLIVSLVKPGLLNRIIKRELSRKQSSLGLGAILIILFVLIGITAPPNEKSGSKVKGETATQEIASPSPENSPTPSPSPLTSSPSPSPSPAKTVVSSPSPTTQPNSSSARSGCDSSYPTVCIAPPPPDLDCKDVSYKRFKVLPPDPHNFDGNHDGVGCER